MVWTTLIAGLLGWSAPDPGLLAVNNAAEAGIQAGYESAVAHAVEPAQRRPTAAAVQALKHRRSTGQGPAVRLDSDPARGQVAEARRANVPAANAGLARRSGLAFDPPALRDPDGFTRCPERPGLSAPRDSLAASRSSCVRTGPQLSGGARQRAWMRHVTLHALTGARTIGRELAAASSPPAASGIKAHAPQRKIAAAGVGQAPGVNRHSRVAVPERIFPATGPDRPQYGRQPERQGRGCWRRLERSADLSCALAA